MIHVGIHISTLRDDSCPMSRNQEPMYLPKHHKAIRNICDLEQKKKLEEIFHRTMSTYGVEVRTHAPDESREAWWPHHKYMSFAEGAVDTGATWLLSEAVAGAGGTSACRCASLLREAGFNAGSPMALRTIGCSRASVCKHQTREDFV